ncbi:MAG: hypothetical protein ACRBM6_15790 [Geminicoccales bacterium]
MSRASFDRSDNVWPTAVAEMGMERANTDDLEADDLYIERDSVLESDLFETSLEDYDDILSIAEDDYLEQ